MGRADIENFLNRLGYLESAETITRYHRNVICRGARAVLARDPRSGPDPTPGSQPQCCPAMLSSRPPNVCLYVNGTAGALSKRRAEASVCQALPYSKRLVKSDSRGLHAVDF